MSRLRWPNSRHSLSDVPGTVQSTFLGAYDRHGVSHGHRRRTRSTLKRWRKRERSSGVSATGTDYSSRFAADMNVDWHPAPRRQFIITLSGPGYEIETSDGSGAQLPPGSVLLVEDIDPAHRLLSSATVLGLAPLSARQFRKRVAGQSLALTP